MIKSSLRALKLQDRDSFLCELCKGKRVLHLGATDAPETEAAIRQGRMLHFKLRDVASCLVGMDNNQGMIDYLREKHGVSDIRYGDIEVVGDYPRESFDVAVVGEILEHLSNPGRALDALRSNLADGATVVVTVPNAYALKGFLRACAGHEFIHPDHTLHHSLHTLQAMLFRHGFVVERAFSFYNGGWGVAALLANWVLCFFPQLAEGIGVVCRPVEQGSQVSGQ